MYYLLSSKEIDKIRTRRMAFFHAKEEFEKHYTETVAALNLYATKPGANPKRVEANNAALAIQVDFYNAAETLLTQLEAIFETTAWTFGRTHEQMMYDFMERLMEYAQTQFKETQRPEAITLFHLISQAATQLTLLNITPEVAAYLLAPAKSIYSQLKKIQ